MQFCKHFLSLKIIYPKDNQKNILRIISGGLEAPGTLFPCCYGSPDTYAWSPATNLSSVNIPNPVALFASPSTGIQYKVVAYTHEGCSDSAYIVIKVFKTLPTVLVPSAFTPGNDGLNDVLRPIAVGIKSIEYFNIYNRWGQLLFSAKTNGHGWDGKINNQLQPT